MYMNRDNKKTTQELVKEKKIPAVKIPKEGPDHSDIQDKVNGITILSIPASPIAKPMVNNPINSTTIVQITS